MDKPNVAFNNLILFNNSWIEATEVEYSSLHGMVWVCCGWDEF